MTTKTTDDIVAGVYRLHRAIDLVAEQLHAATDRLDTALRQVQR